MLPDPAVGAVEIMADSRGTLAVAAQHPLSRGVVRALAGPDLLANNGTVAGNVALDPRYCSHPADCALLVAALGFNLDGIVGGTEAVGGELAPRPGRPWDAKENEEEGEEGKGEGGWDGVVRARVQTEFHASGTTAMMPVELGGVVGRRLVVHGTANVRVVDAGVMPLVVAAHLQAAVYAVAEKVGFFPLGPPFVLFGC